MTDHYLSAPAGPHGALRARPPPLRTASRSRSPSHRRRASDDLLSKLTPGSVVEAFQNPTGPLKACLDRASALEQAFALKTAITSKTIHDWLEELSSWPWPSAGASNGFELPPGKKRKLLEPETLRDSHEAPAYFGSLSAEHVAQYEKRIEQIRQEMEGLNLEEIKNQVLHKHILPLTRPETPYSDSGRSTASSISFSKMEDLTAVVTTITVQTLPALSKLTKLLNTWSVRLVVLRKVPSLLMMIESAEVALRAGWNAIESLTPSPSETVIGTNNGNKSTKSVSQKDVDVMKTILEQKVAGPGRDLDYMLDTLEGMEDTLPDEWLDRMELVERDYAKWISEAERTVKEAELSKLPLQDRTNKRADTEITRPNIPNLNDSAPRTPANVGTSDYEPLGEGECESWAINITESGVEGAEIEISKESSSSTHVGSEGVQDDSRNLGQPRIVSELTRQLASESLNPSPKHDMFLKPPVEDEFEPSVLESVNEEDEEPELPPLYPKTRKCSDSSDSSHVPRGLSNYSPRSFDASEPFESDAMSPSSSPTKGHLAAPNKNVSRLSPLPQFSNSSPRSPLGPPLLFDPDSPSDWDSQRGNSRRTSPGSATNDEDQLQMQLRVILQSIPAKIELKKNPSFNLNPPDLQLPGRPKNRPSDASRRPTSVPPPRADSRMTYSRSATPSFMLAPVREARQRSMSSQGIQLYHLSRSGETPIKLFIRCVGEHNERVMVRVGGGWSDLGEYLRDYALHHGSRSKGEGKVTVTDAVPVNGKRPASSLDTRSNSTQNSPLAPPPAQRTRKNSGDEALLRVPTTPSAKGSSDQENNSSPSEASASVRSRASSHVDWDEEDLSLGLAGPKAAKRRDISAESRAWIESVKAKVRLASSERITNSISSEHIKGSQTRGQRKMQDDGFGDMGKAGTTKRLFRKN